MSTDEKGCSMTEEQIAWLKRWQLAQFQPYAQAIIQHIEGTPQKTERMEDVVADMAVLFPVQQEEAS